MVDRERAQERITACWNVASASYDAQPGHGLLRDEERIAWHAVLREALPPPPADVLDVGTGTGFLAFRAQELGHRAHGIDLANDMLAVARDIASNMPSAPKFFSGDAIAPPFGTERFDAVMNRHLLWTLTDPEQALRNWRELLRPGGRLVVVDGIWQDRDHDDEDHDDENGHPGDEFYTAEVVAQLPQFKSVTDVVEMLRRGGFRAVREMDLTSIDEAEGHLESTRGRYGLVAER